jgi:serine protease Do
MNLQMVVGLAHFIASLVAAAHAQPPIPNNAFGAIMVGTNVVGTGFVTAGDPTMVITCAHVVTNGGGEFTYGVPPNVRRGLSLRATMPQYDIAFLKLSATQALEAVRIGDIRRIRPGDSISYVGWDKLVQTFKGSRGTTVTAIGTALSDGSTVEFLEFHGRAIPGYSGGPVFNDKWEVVAIVARAWTSLGIKGGEPFIINRAFSIEPVVTIHRLQAR